MAIIWAYVLHLAKGILGLLMSFLFAPSSYDMIDQISDFPKDQHLSFDQLGDHINQGFKDYFKLQLSKKKIWLLVFFILSAINQMIDAAAYIFILVMFGKEDYKYASVFMMFINFGFGISSFIYIGWAILTVLKLPK